MAKGKSGGTKNTVLDIMSVVGLFLGVGLIVFSMVLQMPDPEKGQEFDLLWGNIELFIDIPSILIVVGGTIAALMVSYPIAFFARIPGHLKIIMNPTKFQVEDYIKQVVEMAQVARAEGVLALQNKIEQIEDPFFKSSLNLVIDAVDTDKARQMMESELEYMDDRHAQDRGFYAKGSAYAPAFGMIGTLIGLINLLQNLEDANAIAPAMSVALVTTFYGSVLANLIFAPINNKLKVRHDEEYLCKMIVFEGVQAIQAGDNPRFIEEKLTLLLSSKTAANLSGEGGGKKKKKK